MYNPKLTLRRASTNDLSELQQMFVDTVMAVCIEDYSIEQLKAWASGVENTQRWADILALHYFLVAELDNKIVGYISLDSTGYIDLLYTHKDYQKQGIADTLYTEVEKEARQMKVSVLCAHVSKTAKSFFEKKGFVSINEQKNHRQGIEIINYFMTKKV